jgi:23S rRNA (cytosine1962-C5)-methyltransferase
MTYQLLIPSDWADYELLDSGGFEKLERFGRFTVSRPEPQALWNRSLPDAEWDGADARFLRTGGSSDERGEWSRRPAMPEQWRVGYKYGEMALSMRLGLTAFKHVGLFPEQAANWNFLYDNLLRLREKLGRPPLALNLFAYTGGATLAARAAGAEVTHLDSVRQVVGWARGNLEHSGMDGVRWIVDDAAKFVRREVTRGHSYDAIILDPPAYGRGPDGEKWVLEQHLNPLLADCARLLSFQNSLLVVNLYSMGLSALLARELTRQLFGAPVREEFGELCIPDRSGKTLPLGIFYRFLR